MKYRLIKWYPSLHNEIKEGDIAKPDGTSYLVNEIFYISRSEVENNPEYWEKVEEKNYEILKVKGTGTKMIKDYSEYLSIGQLHDIYSIKRLSDGEVFTVGDETINGEIKELKISENRSNTIFAVTLPVIHSGVYLEDLVHKKEPFFTTEDGVDIYKGDTYWELPHGFNHKPSKYEARTNKYLNDKYTFSTEEKALKFLEENKPRYSRNDLRYAIRKANMATGELHEGTLKRSLDEDL